MGGVQAAAAFVSAELLALDLADLEGKPVDLEQQKDAADQW